VTQFSLFGAAAVEPALDDLDGVLLAGGQWVRSGAQARLSVVVADRWRADALADEFAARAVGCPEGEPSITPAEAGFGVRTAFSADLVAAAARWTRGANLVPPPAFALTAGGLRLWATATGKRDEVGFLLATPSADDTLHRIAGAQLSRLGLAAVSLTQRAGHGWRVTSAKRLRRLAELVGPAPAGGEPEWPA
jgi:hypothetical protein